MSEPDEWYDLSGTTPVDAFNVTGVLTMDQNGAGRFVLVSLRDERDGNLYMGLLDPKLAGQLGWEMTGIANGYAELFEDDQTEDD